MAVTKETVKKEAVKTVEAVKEAVDMVEKKAEPVKKAVEKKVEKAVKTTKTAAKTAAKKAAPAAKKAKEAVEKALPKDKAVLQISGKADIDVDTVIDACKADYKAKGHRVVKDLCVYIKPEDNAAYYTVAGKGSEDFKVEL